MNHRGPLFTVHPSLFTAVHVPSGLHPLSSPRARHSSSGTKRRVGTLLAPKLLFGGVLLEKPGGMGIVLRSPYRRASTHVAPCSHKSEYFRLYNSSAIAWSFVPSEPRAGSNPAVVRMKLMSVSAEAK